MTRSFVDSPSRPPRLLVSVRDAAEAEAACVAGADLIDAKDPDRGALGALPPDLVRAIVARVGSRAVTSAVAGEPAEAGALAACIAAMAATGVAYVKVAIRADFTDGDLSRAATFAPGRLIAVLFAERGIDPAMVARLAASGFAGAMIDTTDKDGRRLTDLIEASHLAAFAAACRADGLLSGLAGSLRLEDIAVLAPLGPTYLGFRGGLCEGADRRAPLDPVRVAEAAACLRGLKRRDAA
ncbi:MAG TPA: (5-formylfuran-3-yl)methyl phosphate synthase [Methylobacterium sp.]